MIGRRFGWVTLACQDGYVPANPSEHCSARGVHGVVSHVHIPSSSVQPVIRPPWEGSVEIIFVRMHIEQSSPQEGSLRNDEGGIKPIGTQIRKTLSWWQRVVIPLE